MGKFTAFPFVRCLFLSITQVTLQEVRDITEEWIEEYNAIRPHDALQGLPPYEYAATNS